MKKNLRFSKESNELSILDFFYLNLLSVKLAEEKIKFTKFPIYLKGSLIPINEN